MNISLNLSTVIVGKLPSKKLTSFLVLDEIDNSFGSEAHYRQARGQ